MNNRSCPIERARFFPADPATQVEWRVSNGLTNYETALFEMEKRVDQILHHQAPECVWLLEHPPIYTAGTSAKPADLKNNQRFPVYASRRGGQYTYHGPGQRVAYVMLDLSKRKRDVRIFVRALEQWLIDTLAMFNIVGERREDRVGVWVKRPDRKARAGNGLAEDKIAALGIRLKKWVSFHGISINVAPDLSHFDGIIPCGIREHGVTSFEDLGFLLSMNEVDIALQTAFERTFGMLTPGSSKKLIDEFTA